MSFISNRLPQSNGLYSDTARVLLQRSGLQFVAVTLERRHGDSRTPRPAINPPDVPFRGNNQRNSHAPVAQRHHAIGTKPPHRIRPPYSCCANLPSCGAVSWSNASVQCAETD